MSLAQEEPAFTLAGSRIAILGLGLMGGSLALGLRGRCRELTAVDPDPATRSLALERRIVDRISADPAEILPDADLLILAAPVRAILQLIPRLADWHPGSPVVIDLGSTKREICAALGTLPDRFQPLGGHPMCGKETGGLAHAEAGIFHQATFALTRLARTTERAAAAGEALAKALGARTLWIDPHTHDRWTAATSHLPYLLSVALARATPPEAAPLVGPGFRSTSRLAGSSRQMMGDILATNRQEVLPALERLRAELERLIQTYQDTDLEGLLHLCEQGAQQRAALLTLAALEKQP